MRLQTSVVAKKRRKRSLHPSFEQAYRAAYLRVFSKEDSDSWTPHYWLAFILIGLPAGNQGRAVLSAGIIKI